MDLKLVLFTTIILSYKVRTGVSRSIQKRSLFQLCDLIYYHSQQSCLVVNDYGCFCGLGQHGHNPLDNIDRCCYEHDICYGNLNRCHWYLPQLTHYWYTCDDRTVICMCTGNWYCQQDVCECDLKFAQCLKDALRDTEYNSTYKNYDLSLCL
ncbi:acidic phospholipase A2 PLA-1-like [Ylistrum balloti]|uniref:acidic phospholipase A2 PLA-1-like n=1 Tax=Ylistrum balloti TaxID=509963 RepID=UPI002905A39A|nr:acidic phospholipase A2 PLA-1-like [Ylistrum balloti]